MKTHYVCSDFHGMLNHYNMVMNYIENQNKDYTLYFLGDAADRGADGYQIIKNLLNNHNVVYLKGNHEELLIKAIEEFLDIHREEYFNFSLKETYNLFNDDLIYIGHDCRNLRMNGGQPTFEAWLKDTEKMDVFKKLKALPIKASYKEYDMCHAGCTKAEWNKEDAFAMIWNRTHFKDSWFDNRTLIFGHTPIVHVRMYLNENIISDKIPIDYGCFFTKQFCLYDMDKKKKIMFEEV